MYLSYYGHHSNRCGHVMLNVILLVYIGTWFTEYYTCTWFMGDIWDINLPSGLWGIYGTLNYHLVYGDIWVYSVHGLWGI